MLDKRTSTLLKYIVSCCETGTYTIISISDMINIFEKKYKIDSIAIGQMLTYLKDREYLDIKYGDEKCYCVCPLPKARIDYENTQNIQKNNKKIEKIAFFCVILSFLLGFLGSFLGVVLSKILL